MSARAIDLGNGDAGMPLSGAYIRDKNAEAIIKSLPCGVRQGIMECLIWMAEGYEDGFYLLRPAQKPSAWGLFTQAV